MATEATLLTKDRIQKDLSDRLLEVFDFVVEEKSDFYSRNPDKIPQKIILDQIVDFYVTQNSAISSSVGLVPSPVGMAAAVPEISLILRNQARMVFDVGAACGKTEMINKELLAGVFAHAMELSAIRLISIRNESVVVRQASFSVFQKIVELIAGHITQQTMKSIISKWLPFVGSTAMSTWSKISTEKIGKRAKEIFERQVTLADESFEMDVDIDLDIKPVNEDFEKSKLLTLANLMKIDGKIKQEELDFIELLIEKSELSDPMKEQMRNVLKTEALSEIDLQVFHQESAETVGLIIDLVALAKRDGEFHITEQEFIKKVGGGIGFNEKEIASFMEMNFPGLT